MLEMGGRYLGAGLRDAPSDASAEEYQARLADDGYVLLRGALDREAVLAAGRSVLRPLVERGDVAADGEVLVDASAHMRYPGDWKDPALRSLLRSPPMREALGAVLGAPAHVYDYLWVRPFPPGGATRFHWDAIFWDGAEVHTCWIPLGDVPIELGPLAVVPGPPGARDEPRVVERGVRTALDAWDTVDMQACLDRWGARLETTDFRAGDLIVFTMLTPHATLPNTTRHVRLSADIRFQPVGTPVDPDYMGDDPPFLRKQAEIVAARSAR